MLFNFFKNKSGIRINPAKEETLASIKSQTDLLTSDLSSDNGVIPNNIKANVAAGSFKTKNSSGTNIDPATQATLASVQAQISSLTFDSKSAIVTSGIAPALNAGGVKVKDITATNVNPATDESTYLWSRMVKMMESKGTVDANRMKRISVDSFGTDNITGVGGSTSVGVSGGIVPLVTIANDFSQNLTGLYTSTSFVGYNDQMYQDIARNAYAQGIRSKLNFS